MNSGALLLNWGWWLDGAPGVETVPMNQFSHTAQAQRQIGEDITGQ